MSSNDIHCCHLFQVDTVQKAVDLDNMKKYHSAVALYCKGLDHFIAAIHCKILNGTCHPGDHCWGHYPGTLSSSQVTATHLKIGHP